MKKVAIIGTAPSSLYLAPCNNDEWELWGIGGLFRFVDVPNIKNFTRWFDIHDLETIKAEPENFYEWIKNCSFSVYMQEEFAEVLKAVEYPLDAILKTFPRKYFNSTVDYMLALAIYEGYTDIAIYGVNMAQDTEYAEQRPSCEYWCGYCDGAKINLHIPQESNLLKSTYLYGYEQPKGDQMKKHYQDRIKEFDTRILGVTQQEELALVKHGYLHLVKEKSFLLGCRDDAEYYLKQKI